MSTAALSFSLPFVGSRLYYEPVNKVAMKIQLVIIHNDMVVESLELEPGRYTIGRSKDNNIVVQHFSLAKIQGELLSLIHI